MSIVKMKRLRIFGMASDCEELLRKLQHLGCVELRAPTQPSSDPGWQGFTAKSDGELANAQLRMDEFRATLERLKRCSPTNKKGRFPSRPRITERELFDRQIVLEAEETVERVAALEKKRDSICPEQNKLIGQREALTPWLGLDVPLDTASTKHVLVLFGTLSGLASHQAVEAALAEEPVSEEHAELQDAVRLEFEAYQKTDKTLFDSANWFALQTWNGGDKIADLDLVKVLTAGAYPALEWLESMGMEFNDFVTLGGGSLYPRTHGATTPNGTGYIKAFTNTLADRENVQILMDTTGKSLITDGDKVVGVNGTGRDGNAVTLMANKGVILATGGFAGNVELRQKYCEGEKWPDLGPSLTTSNMPGVTGDGIFMAEAVGAELVDMDQIQLLPFCNPQTGATFDITSANCFINKNGERFVREDGRRDEMAKAMIAQPEGLVYYIFSCEDPNEVYSLGKQTLQYYLDNNLYGYMIDTSLEGLAEQMGVPADTLAKTVEEFNAHTKAGDVDEFGRTSWAETIEGPYYVAYQRKPAAHHTMGGVRIDTETHALRADGSIIEGLYCAGEIVGGIHGGNRLGGNAIVDFCVFGRLAGTHAATD